MHIIPVEDEYRQELISLMLGYFDFYQIENPSIEKIIKLIDNLIDEPTKGIQFLILSKEKKAVGFVTLYYVMSTLSASQVILMNDLYVDPSYRGQGYGKALFEFSMEFAKKNGYPKMEWITEPDNARARKFYESMGGKWSEWIYFKKNT